MKRVETIKDQKLFNNIIRNGKFIKNNFFVIYNIRKEEVKNYYGIAISNKVGNAVVSGECENGILICGTGIGISIAANKFKGIRCALVSNEYCAQMTKRHNNANMLAFGGRVTGPDLAKNILDAYINAEFEGGRHQNRVDKISAIEE